MSHRFHRYLTECDFIGLVVFGITCRFMKKTKAVAGTTGGTSDGEDNDVKPQRQICERIQGSCEQDAMKRFGRCRR